MYRAAASSIRAAASGIRASSGTRVAASGIRCCSSKSSSLTPETESIDLEARGFAILRQNSALPKAAVTEDMGHRMSTSGKSYEKVVQRFNNIFQRGFSSNKEEATVIGNMIYLDDYDRRKDNLKSLRECLSEESIVKTIRPGGLLRKDDLAKFGKLALGNLGFYLLRQLAGLATLNLMRGLNICELIKLENLMWSTLHKGIVLNDTCLAVDGEPEGCPYAAAKKVFDECLELSTGMNSVNVRLPKHVNHYLHYLESASQTDKRVINNHAVTMFPGERIQRKSRINQLLRQKRPPGTVIRPEDKDLVDLSSAADGLFQLFSEAFPWDLLSSSGLHPCVDCWASESQKLRGVQTYHSPVSVPILEDGRLPLGSEIELGSILVALNRDPFEHLYQPLFEGKWKTSYTALDVEQLLTSVNPMYIPVAHYYFMIKGFWHLLEVDPGRKPPYFYWTDISWEPRKSRFRKTDSRIN